MSTQYGLLAEAMSHPDDFSSVTYRLRAQAKLHDGRPVTPEDVIFLLNALKTYHPFYSAYYRHVTKVEKSGERDVVFTFDAPGNRELPQIIGQLTVLPKHWWEGTDGQGRKLRHQRHHAGAAALPPGRTGSRASCRPQHRAGARQGLLGQRPQRQHRAQQLRRAALRVFPRFPVALEAFKGDQVDWRTENSAKKWATAYDFPPVADKRVVLEEFPNRSSGVMQAFAMNIRRDKFKDARVRPRP